MTYPHNCVQDEHTKVRCRQATHCEGTVYMQVKIFFWGKKPTKRNFKKPT